jgi:para-nitrobenzyl esterase
MTSEPLMPTDSHFVVAAPCGRLAGRPGKFGGRVWLGIPYGLPPAGAWRWKAPRPVPPWSDVRPAVEPGSPSPQRRLSLSPEGAVQLETSGTEDCLYLNVWTPAQSEGGPRPVMVWIHGGANHLGQGDSYDSSRLSVSQDVVVVTINYRLGLFGWCAHPALRAGAEDDRERSGNFAVLDQILALEWVRDNITAFGGDPGNVTIFGESAGGWNVFALLGSPLAAGLFHRAIVQSGGDATVSTAMGENFVDDPEPGEAKSSGEILLALLTEDGLAHDRAAAKAVLAGMSHDSVAAYLRAKTFADFARVSDAIGSAYPPRYSLTGFPHLFRDGVVLPAGGIRRAIETGNYNKVPVILGTNRDEYRLMLPLSGGMTFARPQPTGMAFIIDNTERYGLASEYLSRLWKADSVDEPALALERSQPGAVFAYRFDWDELMPAPWLDGIALGACHGLDVPFVFGHRELGPEFIQTRLFDPASERSFEMLSAAMMSYWAEFARTGDPGHGRDGSLPVWRPWGTAEAAIHQTQMLLDSWKRGGPRMATESETKADLLMALARDGRFRSPDDRCRLLRDLVAIKLGWRFTEEDYAMFGDGACTRAFPLP